jgi:hypothetical protein
MAAPSSEMALGYPEIRTSPKESPTGNLHHVTGYLSLQHAFLLHQMEVMHELCHEQCSQLGNLGLLGASQRWACRSSSGQLKALPLPRSRTFTSLKCGASCVVLQKSLLSLSHTLEPKPSLSNILFKEFPTHHCGLFTRTRRPLRLSPGVPPSGQVPRTEAHLHPPLTPTDTHWQIRLPVP